MSNRLDPLIVEKLQAFSQRRRKLIIYRGIYAAVATLLATMMLIAVIDWMFVLPDGVRWGLSAAAYLTILIVEWRACLRLLVFAPGPKRLARLVEHAAPNLREDLISAVELGSEAGDAIYDSEQFRELLQANVASRMESINMERLLPMQLVRRSLAIVIAIAVACVVIFSLTGFQFGTLMMRALLPMANLGRVSKVKVAIVEPQPAEDRIPQGDTVPLLIEISGQRTNKAMLETFTKTGGRELVQMHPVSADRFSATIQVGREDVLYRVRAGDAITKKYRLEAVARPAVISFEKTYTYPAYSRLGTKKIVEENGDLAALDGTQVDLRIKANQKISKAELHVEQGKKTYTLDLVEKEGFLTGSVKLDASGVYRVRLIAAGTGFENKFSPEFELRADPDLAPQVDLELPKEDLILPSNEIVQIEGEASDDLALAKVSQLVKINDGGWKETPLLQNPGAKTKVERRWDLFEQGVKPGDLVTTKLLAVDLKGNRAESRPVQVSITAAGFEVKRVQSLESQRQLNKALQSLRTAAEKLEQRGRETREVFERTQDGDAQRKQAIVAALGALEDFDHSQAQALTQLYVTLKQSEPGHESGQTTLIGHLLARSQNETSIGRTVLGLLNANIDAPYGREQLHEEEASFGRTVNLVRVADDAERTFLAGEEIDVLNENVRIVSQEEQRLTEIARNNGNDAQKWPQVANRQRVIVSEARSLEELMESAAAHAANGGSERLRHMQKNLNKARIAADQALTSGKPPGPDLLNPTINLASALTETTQHATDLKRDMAHVPSQMLPAVLNEAQTIYGLIEPLRWETENLLKNTKLPDDARTALVDARWTTRLGLMKVRGDVEESRPDADNVFVQDLRTTTRALQGAHDSEALTNPEKLGAALGPLVKDMRLLESVRRLGEIVDGLHNLATNEHWGIYNPRARTTGPTNWRWFEDRLKNAPEDLNRALVADDIRQVKQAVHEALWKAINDGSKQRLDQEMNDRIQSNDRAAQSVTKEAERLSMLVKNAMDLLKKQAEEARKEIAKLAPTVSQMAAQLAKETEKLKEKTEAEAQKAPEQKRDEAKAEAQQTLAAQQALNDKVEALKDALRADANQQDILKKEGREKARDADDALAMLKEPPVRAEEDLQRAAQNDQAAARQQAMEQAANQQQKLAEALDKVAQHYDKVEKGENADQTREALRATEQQNGVKDQLNEEFAKAEKLAEMAEASPADLLKQLEKALPQNPVMRQELSSIARDTLKNAADQLQRASNQEKAVTQQVDKLAADQQAQAAAKAKAEADAKAQADAQAKAQAEAQAKAQAEAQTKAQAAQAQNPQGAQNPQQQPQSAQAAQNNPAQNQANNSQQQPQNNPQANPDSANPQNPADAQKNPQSAQAQNPQGQNPQAQNPQAQNQAQNSANPQQQPANAQQQAQPQQAPDPALAQAAQQQTPIAQNANDAGNDVARAGRHEQRLQNTKAGEQLQQLGERIQNTAQQQVPDAQKALAQAQQAAQAQAPLDAANRQLQGELGQLNAAANEGTNADAQADAAAQQNQQANAQNANAQMPATPQDGSAQQAQAQAQGQQAPANQANPQSGAQPQPANANANAQGQQPANSGQQQQGNQPASGQQAAQNGSPAGQQSPPPSGNAQAGQTPGQTPGSTPNAQAPKGQDGEEGKATEIAAAQAPIQQQVWMARTLDALDAAMHSEAGNTPDMQGGQKQSAQPQSGQSQQPGQPQPGEAQPSSAQSAMSAAAQAAAAAMRASRSETPSEVPGGPQAKGGQQVVSKGGAQVQAAGTGHGALNDAKNQAGDWGKLPKKMAEQLSQGRQEGVPGEYRNQVETYYRVIAEKSKKQ